MRCSLLNLPTPLQACTASRRGASQTPGITSSRTFETIAVSNSRRRPQPERRQTLPIRPIRHSSTNSASLDSNPASSSSPPTSLTWNEYLALRRSRRNYNLAASVATSACTTAGGLTLVSTYFDLIGTWITPEPVIIGGLGLVLSAGTGWLSGPILGSTMFRMSHRKVVGEMAKVRTDNQCPLQVPLYRKLT